MFSSGEQQLLLLGRFDLQVRLGGTRRAEPRPARGGRAGHRGARRVGEALQRRVERAHRRPARCSRRIRTFRIRLLRRSAARTGRSARVVDVLRACAQRGGRLRARPERQSCRRTRYYPLL